MNGIWILLLLMVTAALPVIIVFFWFRRGASARQDPDGDSQLRKSPVTLSWFLVSLAAGIISLFAAALIQKFFPPLSRSGLDGSGPIFFDIYIRVALVEEASRFVILIPLFIIGSRRRNMDISFCGALGLVAGLGFAMLENAFYGMADTNITLLRAFTAAPLHGACGIRVGMAVFVCKQRPVRALVLFISAVLIHGTYNMMIVNPAFPSALAVLVAFAALLSPLSFTKLVGKDTENIPKST